MDKSRSESVANQCEECLNEPIIYSECDCSCTDCRCHHVIPNEILKKHNSQEDVDILIVGAICPPTGGTGDYWGSPYWYYTKKDNALISDNWHGELIESFPFEEGYEYVIFARKEDVRTSIDTYHIKYIWLETVSKITKQPYNLPQGIGNKSKMAYTIRLN